MSQLEHLLQQCTVKLTLPGRSGWGTGFFVAPGWILTCAHVVKEAKGEPVQVRWQNQENWAQAVVERSIADPYDLALLRVTLPSDVKPPCVYLDEEFSAGHALYAYGYSDEFPEGASLLGECEGDATENNSRLILFKATRVRSGMSGSPLLNLQTKAICGIVKFTRDRSLDLGGGAIPTHVILEQFPQLRDLQREFHGGDRRWSGLLPAITSQSETLDAEAVQLYLRSLSHYEQWWDIYRLTETISARQATFTFGQIVQTEEPSEKNPTQKKTTPWPLLQGIIHYAKLERVKSEHAKSEHVLLVGSPGAGKSTTLLRLLAVLAKQELQNTKPRIPVLVKLKNYQKPVSGAEDSSGMLTLIKEALEPELFLEISEIKTLLFEEKRFFLLLDGLNEIPADIVRSKLTEFRAQCDRANIPLVCTTRSFGDSLGIQRRLDLQALSDPEIKRFLRECMPGQEEQVLKLLNKDNRELGKTPFVLWMLYDVSKNSDQVPESLGEAFRRFTKSYTSYKIHHEGVLVSPEDFEYWNLLLEYLAFDMLRSPDPHDPGLMISERQATGMLLQFPSTEAIDQRQAQSLLNNLLKYHLLQKSHKGEVSFCHQLIQEYYAAEHLLQQLPTLLEDENKFKRDYLNYLKWTEAIALMSSMMKPKQALSVVKLALTIDLMLGARLAGEVPPEFQKKTVDSVAEEIRKQQVSQSYEIQLLGSTHSDYAGSILLKKFVNEKDQNLIIEFAFALIEIGSRSIVEDLLPFLDYEIPFMSTIVIFILGGLGDEKIIPTLQEALKHSNSSIREQAAEALGELNTDVAVPDLLDALKDKSCRVREKAVEALGNLRSKLSISELVNVALTDSSTHPPWMAAEALKKICPEQATEELLKALKNENYEVRKKAVEALGIVGSETAIDGLISALEDNQIDGVVAKALEEIGSKKAVPGLLKALEHQYPWVCEQAAFVLGRLNDSIAVPSLINVLGHWEPQVQREAIEALGKLGNKTAIPRLWELLQNNPSDNIHRNIVIALGRLGDERVREELLSMLNSQAFNVPFYRSDDCWQVFEALERISSQSVILQLIQVLRSPNLQNRWKAAETLGNLGNKAAIDGLITALLDENSTVCSQSAGALGKFDSKLVMPKLSPLLKHPDPDVRKASVQVLGNFEDESAITALLDALRDTESSVRYEAAQSLIKLSNSEATLGVAKVLSYPCKKQLLDNGLSFLVQATQENCKFYNYEIWQEAIQNKNDGQTSPKGQLSQPSSADLLAKIDQTTQRIDQQTQQMSNEPRNNLSGATFNAPVNFGDNPTGNFIGTQNNYVTDPEVQSAIADLQTLLTQFQTQYPQVTTESQALDIIDAEFTEIKQAKTHWLATLRKQILNPERHLQASKAALGEVAKHYLEESVWVKALLTYLDKLSEDPNHGA